MKMIHTSDWHLGKMLNGYSLLEDQRFWLQQFLKEMERLQPDVLILAGDIYDRPIPPAAAVSLLGETLHHLTKQLHMKVFMIGGNHDSGERLNFGRELFAHQGVYIAGAAQQVVQTTTLHDEFGPIHFHLLPYVDRYVLKKLCDISENLSLSELTQKWCEPLLNSYATDQRHILIAHGFFSTSKSLIGNQDLEVGTASIVDLSPFSSFDYIALGHIHAPKKAGFFHARYAGSPLKYSLSEASHQKSCYLVTLKQKSELTIESIRIQPKRDLRLIVGDFQDLLSQAKENEDLKELDDYVFCSITDSIPVTDAVPRLKTYYPNLLGVDFPAIVDLLPPQPRLPQANEQRPSLLLQEFYEKTTGQATTTFQQQMIGWLFETSQEEEIE